MRLTKFILPVAAVSLLMMTSCKKELDLDSDNYYSVRDFEKSTNVQADCGEKADCEGKTVRLTGRIDGDNINRETHVFWLNDEDNSKFTIEIKVEPSISDAVFDMIETEGGKKAKVKGIAEGFDKPTNYQCEREIYLIVFDPADVELLK